MTMKRGDAVEVYLRDECLKGGSWFRATLEDSLPKAMNEKLNVSLLTKDGSTIRKTTLGKFIRPVPPQSLFTAADFEEGCVVEASRGGGWWTGLVVKKINHENVVWVYLDSLPDLFQFKTSQVRQCFVWERQEWVRRGNKVLNKKCTYRCGTMVEVKVMDDDDDDVWVPSVIVKVMVDKRSLVVKTLKNLSWNDDGEVPKPNRTVGLSSIRLTPAPVSVERSYGLMDSVEVFLEPGWRSGTVKSILSENRYTVLLNATNESLVFKHDALRPSGVSITTVVSQESSEVNAAVTPQTSLSSGENGEKEVSEEHNREDESRKRKRGEIEHNPDLSEIASPLARINKLVSLKDRQRKAMEEQNGFNREVMALKEECGEIEQKILELERQKVILKEKMCEMESCASDRGIVLDKLESEFIATASDLWDEI